MSKITVLYLKCTKSNLPYTFTLYLSFKLNSIKRMFNLKKCLNFKMSGGIIVKHL